MRKLPVHSTSSSKDHLYIIVSDEDIEDDNSLDCGHNDFEMKAPIQSIHYSSVKI